MIILSVLTIPQRINHFINVLDELLLSTRKPDFIYITISEFYPRLNLSLTKEELTLITNKLETYPIPNKLVILKEDLGTLSKLLTPFTHHKNLTNDDYIIILDDDNGLFPLAIHLLTNQAYECDELAVYGLVGKSNGEYLHGEFFKSGDYYPVDILEGYRGVIYPIRIINTPNLLDWLKTFIDGYKQYNMIPIHDDEIFNYYLQLNNIESRIVNIPMGDRFNLNYKPKPNTNGIQEEKIKDKYKEILNLILNEIKKPTLN